MRLHRAPPTSWSRPAGHGGRENAAAWPGAITATQDNRALAAWEIQAHRTLAANPDPADLVQVARVCKRSSPAQQASSPKPPPPWARSTATYSSEPFGQALGRTYQPCQPHRPRLVAAASEVRAAIAATATNRNGWATPEQLASRIDLANAVKTLHLSIVASVDIAHVARDAAADHPGLTAPARIIGMRAQEEAEIAVEQGETRYEGVTWTTPRQIAANELIPLPEPARQGLINLADKVIATTNQSVAAAAQLDPSDVIRSVRSGPEARRGHYVEALRIARLHVLAKRDHADELHRTSCTECPRH